jgi:hypothetical protein
LDNFLFAKLVFLLFCWRLFHIFYFQNFLLFVFTFVNVMLCRMQLNLYFSSEFLRTIPLWRAGFHFNLKRKGPTTTTTTETWNRFCVFCAHKERKKWNIDEILKTSLHFIFVQCNAVWTDQCFIGYGYQVTFSFSSLNFTAKLNCLYLTVQGSSINMQYVMSRRLISIRNSCVWQSTAKTEIFIASIYEAKRNKAQEFQHTEIFD